MTRRVMIQIFPDGRVRADIQGVKGKKCTEYLRILEEILDAEVADSEYTSEYYESEVQFDSVETTKQHLKE